MNVNYIADLWRITARGLRYVFESVDDVQWYDNGQRSLAQYTGEAEVDLVRIMQINLNLNDIRGFALPKDYYVSIDRMWLYPDGTPETRRSPVLLYDSNLDGYPDDPDTFYRVTNYGFPVSPTGVVYPSTVIPLANTNGYSVNMTVEGYGIQPGTYIASLTSTSITLSNPTTALLTTTNVIYLSQSDSAPLAAKTIVSITYVTTTATVVTNTNHNLVVGDIVTVSGAVPSAYNGAFLVVSTPTPTSFTYTMLTNPMGNASPVGSYTAQSIRDSTFSSYLFWSNAADPPYVEPLGTVIVYDTDTLDVGCITYCWYRWIYGHVNITNCFLCE